jgi:hypothetical protein
MDVARQEIYIENTLQGGSYWTVSLENFVKAWEQPETSASIVRDREHAEAVTRWAVILNPKSSWTNAMRRAPKGEEYGSSTPSTVI